MQCPFIRCICACAGQYVPRMQTIRGMAFSYQPPPRNIVPYAAALKGQSTRCGLLAAVMTSVLLQQHASPVNNKCD